MDIGSTLLWLEVSLSSSLRITDIVFLNDTWDSRLVDPLSLYAYCFSYNRRARREHLTIQQLWATAWLLVTHFWSYLPSWWALFKGNEEVGQSKVSSYYFCVWYKSKELGGRGSSRFSYVTQVVETSSDRVTFRILPNINNGAPLQKQPTDLTHWLFP